jgi:putative thioredoxin
VTIIEQGSGPAPQAAADLIKETTTQTFVKDVIEESKRQPVLIDFWAPWCGPCRQLTPIIEKAVRAANGKVKLVKMNIDEHPSIPGQMGIQSIPAVIAFVNGQPADGFMGAVPESQVTAFIDKLTAGMPGAGEPNIAEILKEAEAVLAEGDPASAAQIYAEVLAADATNIAALAGLANAMWRPAQSNRPSRRLPWCRSRSAMRLRSRPCRRRSISPNRPRRWDH